MLLPPFPTLPQVMEMGTATVTATVILVRLLPRKDGMENEVWDITMVTPLKGLLVCIPNIINSINKRNIEVRGDPAKTMMMDQLNENEDDHESIHDPII
jgi:hypothetical protein